ncbi:MAG: hypothetical protein WC901_08130 [Candidatus Margulisiibacteriota bacterium]
MKIKKNVLLTFVVFIFCIALTGTTQAAWVNEFRAINFNTSEATTSLAMTGKNGSAVIAWSEANAAGVYQGYCKAHIGGSWLPLGSALNIDRAQHCNIYDATMMNSNSFVSFFEMDRASGNLHSHILMWNGSTWERIAYDLHVNLGAIRYTAYPAICNNGTDIFTAINDFSRLYVYQISGKTQTLLPSSTVSPYGTIASGYLDISSGGAMLCDVIKIAAAKDGNPYVAFTERSGGISQLYVKTWNGADWVQPVTGPLNIDSSQNVYLCDIDISPIDNSPLVVWTEINSAGTHNLYAKKYDSAAGAWVSCTLPSGITNLNVGSVTYPSIAFNKERRITSDHIGYITWTEQNTDTGGYDVHAAKLTSATTVTPISDRLNYMTPRDLANNTDIFVDNQGAHVVWTESDAASNYELNGKRWQ